MGDRELTDLANVLLTAAGAGLALACAYLVMKPATRTFRKWAGATLVALPGLLLGLLLAHPDLGVRSAYGGLTNALLGSSTSAEETVGLPQPEVGDLVSSPSGGSSGLGDPSLSPTGGDVYEGSPDSVEDPVASSSDDTPSSTDPTLTPSSPPVTTTAPPVETTTPPVETTTPPETTTSPPPPETTTPPPPPETTTPPPPPEPTTTPPPPPPPEPSPSEPALP